MTENIPVPPHREGARRQMRGGDIPEGAYETPQGTVSITQNRPNHLAVTKTDEGPDKGINIMRAEKHGDEGYKGALYDADGKRWDGTLTAGRDAAGRPDGTVDAKSCYPGTAVCDSQKWKPATPKP